MVSPLSAASLSRGVHSLGRTWSVALSNCWLILGHVAPLSESICIWTIYTLMLRREWKWTCEESGGWVEVALCRPTYSTGMLGAASVFVLALSPIGQSALWGPESSVPPSMTVSLEVRPVPGQSCTHIVEGQGNERMNITRKQYLTSVSRASPEPLLS